MKTVSSTLYFSSTAIKTEMTNIISVLNNTPIASLDFNTKFNYEDVQVSFFGKVFSEKVRQHLVSSVSIFNKTENPDSFVCLNKIHGLLVHGITTDHHHKALEEVISTSPEIAEAVKFLQTNVSFKRKWDEDDLLGHEVIYENLKKIYLPDTLETFTLKHKQLLKRFLSTGNKDSCIGVKLRIDIETGATSLLVAKETTIQIYDGITHPTNGLISMWLFDNLNDIEKDVLCTKSQIFEIINGLSKYTQPKFSIKLNREGCVERTYEYKHLDGWNFNVVVQTHQDSDNHRPPQIIDTLIVSILESKPAMWVMMETLQKKVSDLYLVSSENNQGLSTVVFYHYGTKSNITFTERS